MPLSPDDHLILAVDAGSRSVKIAHDLRDTVEFIGPIDTSRFFRDNCVTSQSSHTTIELSSLGLTADSGFSLCVTGYGRHSDLLGEGLGFNEISAHVQGVYSTSGLEEFTLLDIGGQDTKVATVSKGAIVDVQTNDRCAASTGRFLESMSHALGMSFEELGSEWDIDAEALSSTCSVFAETEVIQLMATGQGVAELAARVNASVVDRILPMLDRATGQIVMSGGGGLSPALTALLSEHLNTEVSAAITGQFNGAMGCLSLMKESIKSA